MSLHNTRSNHSMPGCGEYEKPSSSSPRRDSPHVRNITRRATMTFFVYLLHNIYQPIKSVSPLAVIVMRVGIGKLMSVHLNTGTDLIACPYKSLIIFFLWGNCLIVSRANSTEEITTHTGLYIAGCHRKLMSLKETSMKVLG